MTFIVAISITCDIAQILNRSNKLLTVHIAILIMYKLTVPTTIAPINGGSVLFDHVIRDTKIILQVRDLIHETARIEFILTKKWTCCRAIIIIIVMTMGVVCSTATKVLPVSVNNRIATSVIQLLLLLN